MAWGQLDFGRQEVISEFLDPRNNFQPVSIRSEIRFDPLTHNTCRIAHFSSGTAPEEPYDHLQRLEAGRPCPFCPELVEKATPRFPTDFYSGGRIHRGEATLFPNLSPYDRFSAISVISAKHIVPLTAFSVAQLRDAFGVALEYLAIVARITKPPMFDTVSWNYLPEAGSSVVHPHLQVLSTEQPTNQHRLELEDARTYHFHRGISYWDDLAEEEHRRGERWIGEIGSISWLTAYAPFSPLFDVLALFRGRSAFSELQPGDLEDFADGLQRVFRYMSGRGLAAFNLGFYTAPFPMPEFTLYARLSPRTTINARLGTSDMNSLRLIYDEPFAVEYPEEVAAQLRPSFASGSSA